MFLFLSLKRFLIFLMVLFCAFFDRICQKAFLKAFSSEKVITFFGLWFFRGLFLNFMDLTWNFVFLKRIYFILLILVLIISLVKILGLSVYDSLIEPIRGLGFVITVYFINQWSDGFIWWIILETWFSSFFFDLAQL